MTETSWVDMVGSTIVVIIGTAMFMVAGIIRIHCREVPASTYGDALVVDGRQFFRTYDGLNVATFVAYLKELQKHFGEVVLMCDRAPQHHSRLIREFLHKKKNVMIMYFPKDSPYLNAVEECRCQGKRRLLVSEYYRTFSDMYGAISTYYRTAWFLLELINYINKKTVSIHTNL